MERLAIKRLQNSDLTFFQSFFEKQREEARSEGRKGTGQKGIGLDKKPFIGLFYPQLSESEDKYDTELVILGPGSTFPYPSVGHMIRLWDKNWRLGGSTVRSPAIQPDRFDSLQEGDLAIMYFLGTDYPEAVRLCLIPADDPLWPHLSNGFSGKNGFIPLPIDRYEQIVNNFAEPDHPLCDLLIDGEYEAPEGSSRPLRTHHLSTREVVDRTARQRLNGEYGERLVNQLFLSQQQAWKIGEFEWTSSIYPTAPWDFRVSDLSGVETLIDVKSTSESLHTPFFMSQAEMERAEQAGSYQIYRVHSVQKDSGLLTILTGLKELAHKVLNAQDRVPYGVAADGWKIHPQRSGLTVVGEVIPLGMDCSIPLDDLDVPEEEVIPEEEESFDDWLDGTESVMSVRVT